MGSKNYYKIKVKRKIKLLLIFALIFHSGLLYEKALAKSMNHSKAVIHHTASHDISSEVIDVWHKERGWNGIGYHFIIRANGVVEEGRDINKIGAHAKGRNHYIGIALTGYDIFTPEQKESLKCLLRQLYIEEIEEHHENCPGKGLDLNKIREEIKRR